MHIGLTLGLTGVSAPSLATQAIRAIRRNNGTLFMVPDNLAGAFIDSTGTQPVSAVGDVLGLLTDRSYGASNLGPELFTGAYWTGIATTATYVGNEATATLGGPLGATSSNWLSIPGASVANRMSVIEFWATWVSGSDLQVGRDYTVGRTITAASNGGVRTRYTAQAFSTVGQATVGRAAFGSTSAGAVWKIEIISVREVLGNHASQPTTANKPVIARVPRRTQGPTNLLTFSSDFGNAAWNAGLSAYTRTVDPTEGPYGDSAWKITATATQSVPYRDQVASSSTVTFAVIHKAGTWASESWLVRNSTTATNLTFASTTTVNLPNGWVLRSMVVNSGITAGNTLRLYFGATGAVPEGQFRWFYRAALFDGSFTAKQIIDNGGIPLTTTAPLPNVLEWTNAISFDGSNDSLSTTITTGNEGWVCAGVTVANHTSNQSLFGNGAGDASTKGVWAAKGSGSSVYTFNCSDGAGGVRNMLSTVAFPAGVPSVLEFGWTPTTMMTAVNGSATSSAKTKDVTHTAGIALGGNYTYFQSGPVVGYVLTPVLPSESDRALIRRWIGSLQGQTL